MPWLTPLLTPAAILVAAVVLSKAKASEWDFWAVYAKVLALCAIPFVGWLVYKAGAASGSWWGSAPAVALVAAITGAIAPATTFIVSWAKIRLDDKRQQHEITSDYLNRALDAEQPLVTRHQLLRFLSTAPRQGDRLHAWASDELRRIAPAFERQEEDALQLQAEIRNAKTPDELQLAEAKLKVVVGRAERTDGQPSVPKVTPASLRAGLFTHKDVGSVDCPGADLTKATLTGTKLRGSNLSGAKMIGIQMVHGDARGSNFDGADMQGALLVRTDLRGSSFVGTNLQKAQLQTARLESCDLTDAKLDAANVLACYDSFTKWPTGFDPVAAGCVLVEPDQPEDGANKDSP